MSQSIFKLPDAEIRWEYRQDAFCVMFTRFPDVHLNMFADLLQRNCTQVRCVDNRKTYENEMGALVIKMKQGYCERKATKEFSVVFLSYFNQHKSCPIIAST